MSKPSAPPRRLQPHFLVGPGGTATLALALKSFGMGTPDGSILTLEVHVHPMLPEQTAWLRSAYGLVQLTEARSAS